MSPPLRRLAGSPCQLPCRRPGHHGKWFRKAFVGHPALDGYPEGTTYVYRSANQYAGRAAAPPEHQHLPLCRAALRRQGRGLCLPRVHRALIGIIEEAVGSIVPRHPLLAKPLPAEDADSYYALQTAMLAQKDSGRGCPRATPCTTLTRSTSAATGYVYFIGIDGGATFFNNYIAPEIDFAGRLAGALLIGGGHAGDPRAFHLRAHVHGQR